MKPAVIATALALSAATVGTLVYLDKDEPAIPSPGLVTPQPTTRKPVNYHWDFNAAQLPPEFKDVETASRSAREKVSPE